MRNELSRRLGYTITYFLSAVLLCVMYCVYETSFAFLGSMICLIGGVVYLVKYLKLKKYNDDD